MPMIITFSTWLTILRMLLAPCVMGAIYGKLWIVASILFMIASATDFFDGYYARLYHQETELGRALDPVADKILLGSTLWALYAFSEQSLLSVWFVCLVAGKDLILMLGACVLLLQKKYIIIEPTLLSKFSTALTMVFSVYVMFVACKIMSPDYIVRSMQVIAICTMLILADYSYKFYQRL